MVGWLKVARVPTLSWCPPAAAARSSEWSMGQVAELTAGAESNWRMARRDDGSPAGRERDGRRDDDGVLQPGVLCSRRARGFVESQKCSREVWSRGDTVLVISRGQRQSCRPELEDDVKLAATHAPTMVFSAA